MVRKALGCMWSDNWICPVLAAYDQVVGREKNVLSDVIGAMGATFGAYVFLRFAYVLRAFLGRLTRNYGANCCITCAAPYAFVRIYTLSMRSFR